MDRGKLVFCLCITLILTSLLHGSALAVSSTRIADGKKPSGKSGGKDDGKKDVVVATSAGFVVFTGIALSIVFFAMSICSHRSRCGCL
jgi:hypothetical protein